MTVNSILAYWYAGGGVLGIVLFFTLISMSVRNRKAVYLLAAVVGVTTVMLAEELFLQLGATHSFGLGLAVEFAIGPLMYLFTCTICQRSFRLSRETVLHFIPLGIALACLTILNLVTANPKASLADHDLRAVIGVWVAVKFLFFCAYAYFSLRKIGWVARHPLSVAGVGHRWLFAWITITCVLVGFVYANFFLFWLGVPSVPDSDVVGGVALSLNTYLFAYFVITRKEAITYVEPYSRSDLSNDDIERIATRINEYLTTSLAHLNPEFGFGDLCAAVELESAKLTEVIKRAFGVGFYQFLNDHRLEAFALSARDPENQHRSVLELAHDAGFNSKSTFYRIFKSKHGITPSVFRDQALAGIE